MPKQISELRRTNVRPSPSTGLLRYFWAGAKDDSVGRRRNQIQLQGSDVHRDTGRAADDVGGGHQLVARRVDGARQQRRRSNRREAQERRSQRQRRAKRPPKYKRI